MSFSSRFKNKKSVQKKSSSVRQVSNIPRQVSKKTTQSPTINSVQRPRSVPVVDPSPSSVIEDEDEYFTTESVMRFMDRLSEDALPSVSQPEAKIMFETLLISLYYAIFDGGHAVRAHNAQKVCEYFGINLINVREQVESLRNIRQQRE